MFDEVLTTPQNFTKHNTTPWVCFLMFCYIFSPKSENVTLTDNKYIFVIPNLKLIYPIAM